MTATVNAYRLSATHHLTIAAIYTPAGEPIADVRTVHDENCTTCPGTPEFRRYARRAARKYLEAYDRQGGVARPIACGMTYAANMLGKALHMLDLELPGDATIWWGHRYRALAEAIA